MLITIVRSMVLTRLLFPEAFGLMAMGSVIGTAAQMFSDVGIQPSIIRSERGEDPTFLKTAWTVSIIRGFCLTLITALLAWPAAVFYREPMVFWVVMVGGLGFIISGFNTTAAAVHQRKMDFKIPSIIGMINPIVNLVVVLLLAWWLRSVWALIIGNLTGQLIGVISGHLFLPGIRHRFRIDRDSLQELFGYGRWIFVSTVLTFLAMQSDKLILGRLMSAEVLGIYSIALVMAGIPQQLIKPITATVLFSAVAEKSRQKDKQLSTKIARAREVVLKVSSALLVGMLVVAPLACAIMFDERYRDAGWLAQWIAISIWFDLLSSTDSKVLLAVGKSRPVAVSNAVNVVVTIAGAIIGFHFFDIEGFLVGYALGNLASAVVVSRALHQNKLRSGNQNVVYTFAISLLAGVSLSIRYAVQLWIDSLIVATAVALIPLIIVSAYYSGEILEEILGRRRGRTAKA